MGDSGPVPSRKRRRDMDGVSAGKGAGMARPVILFSGPWADLPLEELAQKVSEWGYQGLELCCWGDHLEVQRALSEDDYCQKKIELLTRFDLSVPVVSNH